MRRPTRFYVQQRFNANRERILSVEQREQEQQERERRVIQSMKQEPSKTQSGTSNE